MKAIKFLFKFVLWTVAIVLVLAVTLVATLPWWLGSVVKPVANTGVPMLTKTPFRLGVLSLNPYSGRFEIGDLYLGNPANYTEKCAAELGSLVVDVDPATLASDVIHFEEIAVSNLFVSIVYANGRMNFDQISINAEGGEKAHRRNEALKEAKAKGDQKKIAELEAQRTDEEREDDADEAEVARKKVIIDRLAISGLKVSFGYVAIPVPTIVLKDIGKDKGGATWEELWGTILAAISKASGAVGDAMGALGTESLKLGKDVLNVGTKGVTGAVSAGETLGKDTLDAGKKGLDSTIDAAKKINLEGAKDALKSTGDSLKDIGDSLKSLF